MTNASETVELERRIGFAEIATLVLLAGIPLVYLPGLTFEHTYLKLPLFQIVALLGLATLPRQAPAPAPRWWLRRTLLFGAVALLLAWMVASRVWHRYEWAATDSLIREGTFFVGFVGLSCVLCTPHIRKLYARWLGAAAVVAAVLIICFIAAGRANYFGNRNFAGGFLVLPITAMLAFVVASQKLSSTKYWSLAVGLFVMIYALLTSQSLGALAGAVFAGLLVCAVLIKNRRPYFVAAGALIVAAGAAVIIFRPDLVRQALGIRLHIWRAALKLIASQPVLGQGAGAFGAAIRPFQPPEYFAHPAAAATTLHAHSRPLEIMAELGVIGLALWIVRLAALFAAAWQAVRKAADDFDRCLLAGIACGLAGMTLHALVSVGPTSPDVQINFWLGAAFLCGALGVRRAKPRPVSVRNSLHVVFLWVVFGAAFLSWGWPAFQAQRYTAKAVRQEQPVDKLALLEKAESLQPCENTLSVVMRMKKAAAYFALNQLDLALAEYEEIESLGPNYGGIQSSIAHVHRLTDNHAAAAYHAKGAAAGNPFDINAYSIWLEALRHGADGPPAQEAAELLGRAEKLKPFEAALDGLKRRMAKSSAFDKPFFDYTINATRGVLFEAHFTKLAGQPENAAKLYAKAAGQCAALAGAAGKNQYTAMHIYKLWLRIARESGSAEISKEAAQSLKATLGNAGTSRMPADLYYVLGALYWRSGMQKEAELQLKKVAASCQRPFRFGRPDHPHVLGLLASVYEYLHPRLSLEIARKLLEQDPHNETARRLISALEPGKRNAE
ncbi:MAG: O-antigen ligase family protein [Planctomycetes bacterium]|nr:O-antigen ligase family protein [Planctomycetota bacterium]